MSAFDSDTISYYNTHAKEFTADTFSAEMGQIQRQFSKMLPAGASVMDFGCGSGRDTLYFLQQGFCVTATDGSEEMCKVASRNTGIHVRHMLFQKLSDINQYDGIWACASLLHLRKNELPAVFRHMQEALKDHGIIYASFKYGTFAGMRNGRYFTDLDEESLKQILKDIPELTIVKIWVTEDVREERRNQKWINILLRKIPN